MRMIRDLAVLAAVVVTFATASPVHAAGAYRAPARDNMRLPAPATPGEAQLMFAGALAAEKAGEHRHAAIFLDAILRSDHLTDRGRADVYWLAAETWDAAGEEERAADCWGGFLVAASVLDNRDATLQQRESEAQVVWNGWRAKQSGR